jgi:hypothetical protein
MKKLKDSTQEEKEAYYAELTPEVAIKYKDLESELETIE